MRCPKCHYISFGSVDRCRNCGYELALAPDAPAPLDLPLTIADAPLGPLDDLPLGVRPSNAAPRASPDPPPVPARRPAPSRSDLPLFADREGLVAPAPVPPLSVRRSVPAIAKPRPSWASDPSQEAGPFEREFRSEAELFQDPVSSESAPTFRRLLAGAIDVAILGAIDSAVVYFTLRVLGLQLDNLRMLPPVPLGAFLLLLNSAYLVVFTAAGGQTIGKMIAKLRVVSSQEGEDDSTTSRVAAGAAVVRAAVWLASLAPAGLAFAAILFDADGRALHDRAASTRVIKA